MGKYDNNGVRHDGWVAVGEANKNRCGRSGRADSDYERKAREQGVDLSKTGYNRVSGYRSSNFLSETDSSDDSLNWY